MEQSNILFVYDPELSLEYGMSLRLSLSPKTEILSQPLKNQTYQSVRTFRWCLSSQIGSHQATPQP